MALGTRCTTWYTTTFMEQALQVRGQFPRFSPILCANFEGSLRVWQSMKPFHLFTCVCFVKTRFSSMDAFCALAAKGFTRRLSRRSCTVCQPLLHNTILNCPEMDKLFPLCTHHTQPTHSAAGRIGICLLQSPPEPVQ